MKRYDVFVLFILEITMLVTWIFFWTQIAEESQQTITKAYCIQLFNSL